MQGVYIGCSSGEVVLLDAEGGGVLSMASAATVQAATVTGGSGSGSKTCCNYLSQPGVQVVCLAVNEDALFVCGGGSSAPLRWFARGVGGQQMQLIGQAPGSSGEHHAERWWRLVMLLASSMPSSTRHYWCVPLLAHGVAFLLSD